MFIFYTLTWCYDLIYSSTIFLRWFQISLYLINRIANNQSLFFNDRLLPQTIISIIIKTSIMSYQNYKECIEACNRCAVICKYCAVSCLQEENLTHLAKCIRLDLECAKICTTASEIMSLDGIMSEALCNLCVEICNQCAKECEKHAAMGMEHCKECAQECRRCAETCMQMVRA